MDRPEPQRTVYEGGAGQDGPGGLSLCGALWVMPDVPLGEIERMMRICDVPEPVARLLCARGLSPEEAPSFLRPTLRENLPSPLLLQGMEAAARDLAEWIMQGRRMAIFADFDVDGATSAALLTRFLRHCGVTPDLYIPERLTEGYGPNLAALELLKAQGAEVLWMLDCGTTAHETLAAGRAMGLDIVVIDHHEAQETLPRAAHVINPKRKDDTAGLDMLAAVGVTFMTCVAVNAALRARGFFKIVKPSAVDKSAENPVDGAVERGEAPLRAWLDLVALGTVCDMVPLTGVNRLLVRSGLARMDHTDICGIKSLAFVSKVNAPFDPYHCGFVFGPRINAGSRVHKSDLGARLLCTDDPQEAQDIAFTLEDCNSKRKALQAQMEEQAIAEAQAQQDQRVIVVAHQDWHQGLSGLVAGRLKDHFKRPACVIAPATGMDGTPEARGSGRSLPGFHMADALMAAQQAGILIKGGGHAAAGGFTLDPGKIDDFRSFMQNYARQTHDHDAWQEEIRIDAGVTVAGVRPALLRLLQEQIGPFGQNNPEPLFLLRQVRVHSAELMGGAHIRALLSDWEGGARLKAVAFRSQATPLGTALMKAAGRQVDVVGMLRLNVWNGRETPELHIKDARFSL